ncbi:MAG: hypothetical protein C3F11_05430 [Methylocystaceae bacterium]|nr:MAG: hypothetical protein C3F11_05430 [Methylocystaceae bacterium]
MSRALRSLSRFAAATLAGCLLASPGAEAREARPFVEQGQEHYLDIPGLGPVPIPLPPGARVFNPSRRSGPPEASPRAGDERAAGPERRGRKRENMLDALFMRLAGAENVEEAHSIAGSIGRLWARSGSETADLLLARAALAATLGDSSLSLTLFDRIVALEPSWPEGFVGRANARLVVGDTDGAERDFETAVKLEPRRFDALAAMGALQERAGAPKQALDAYRRALSLDPRREEWRKAEERLRLEVEGRDI